MKLDLEKLLELEDKYCQNPILLSTLENMLNLVLTSNAETLSPIAIQTLRDLKILID